MVKLVITILITMIHFSFTFGQSEFNCFVSTEDFVNEIIYEKEVKPLIKKKGRGL